MTKLNQKVVAVHTITRALSPGVAATKDTPGKAPTVETLQPGTIFVIDDKDELDSLVKAGAVSLDIPKAPLVSSYAQANDGPGEPEKRKASDKPKADAPLTAEEKAKLVARGKELGVNGVSESWKDETLRRKVGEAEAEAKAAAQQHAGEDGDVI